MSVTFYVVVIAILVAFAVYLSNKQPLQRAPSGAFGGGWLVQFTNDDSSGWFTCVQVGADMRTPSVALFYTPSDAEGYIRKRAEVNRGESKENRRRYRIVRARLERA